VREPVKCRCTLFTDEKKTHVYNRCNAPTNQRNGVCLDCLAHRVVDRGNKRHDVFRGRWGLARKT